MNISFFSKNKSCAKEILVWWIAASLFFLWKFLICKTSLSFSVENFFNLIILAPVAEEIMFRGVLQATIFRVIPKFAFLKISYANIMTSAIFSFTHLIFSKNLLFSVSVFIPSIIFGYLYDKYKNLIPSILVHAFFNLNFMFIFTDNCVNIFK